MSRTDKDRPYWVILNDKTISMGYNHDHRYLGFQLRGYRDKLKIIDDHCTAFEDLTRNSWDDRHYLPCRRSELVCTEPLWKLPPAYRTQAYRRRRRDFLKGQVKRYNSNYYLHDTLDFMDEDVFETWRDEITHSPSR